MSVDDPLATRRRILAASRRLFNQPGYHDARVADIARMAGVSRATVYNHFTDKEAILADLVEDFISGYARVGESMDTAAEDGSATIFSILLTMVEGTLSWRASNADLRPAVEIARQILPHNVKRANDAADKRLRGKLADIYQRSARFGIVRGDIDLDYVVNPLYGMIDSVLSTVDPASPPDEIKAAALQLALLQWYAVYTIAPEDSPRLGG